MDVCARLLPLLGLSYRAGDINGNLFRIFVWTLGVENCDPPLSCQLSGEYHMNGDLPQGSPCSTTKMLAYFLRWLTPVSFCKATRRLYWGTLHVQLILVFEQQAQGGCSSITPSSPEVQCAP